MSRTHLCYAGRTGIEASVPGARRFLAKWQEVYCFIRSAHYIVIEGDEKCGLLFCGDISLLIPKTALQSVGMPRRLTATGLPRL